MDCQQHFPVDVLCSFERFPCRERFHYLGATHRHFTGEPPQAFVTQYQRHQQMPKHPLVYIFSQTQRHCRVPTHSFTGVLYPISLQTKPLQLLKWIYNKDKDFNSSCSGTVVQVLYIHHSHFSFITMNNPEHLYSCKFSWLVSTRKH